jgi:phosphinothricin acetyltransferase
MIRSVKLQDSVKICKIYNYYIANSIATFEESPVDLKVMKKRISETIVKLPWIVFDDNNGIAGYAYAATFRPRHAYRFTIESTVYVATQAMGRGIGTALYRELMKRLCDLEIHSVFGVIALPNDASVALHEKLGFNKVAHLKEAGFKFNRWIDVGYWQLIFSAE